jgi:hypothetical protein
MAAIPPPVGNSSPPIVFCNWDARCVHGRALPKDPIPTLNIVDTDGIIVFIRESDDIRSSFMTRNKLPVAMREQLSAMGTTLLKPKNAVLFRAGQACRGAFLICSGEVKLSLDDAAHLYRRRTVGPGFIIGLPAVFSGEPYSLTAQTKDSLQIGFRTA